MEYFNKRVFIGAFTSVAGVSITIALAIIVGRGDFAIADIFIGVILALLVSAVIAALIAAYRLYMRGYVWIYRTAMRKLAARALKSALSQAKGTRVECSGIIEMRGTVALRVLVGSSHGIQRDDKFNLYEATGNAYWGSVVAVDVRESDCDCRPDDRKNEDFWEYIEDRMKYVTSKPENVYLVLDTEGYATAINLIIALLRYWR